MVIRFISLFTNIHVNMHDRTPHYYGSYVINKGVILLFSNGTILGHLCPAIFVFPLNTAHKLAVLDKRNIHV